MREDGGGGEAAVVDVFTRDSAEGAQSSDLYIATEYADG